MYTEAQRQTGSRAPEVQPCFKPAAIMLGSFGSDFLGSCLYFVGFHPLNRRSCLSQTHGHAGSWCEERP